jgi:transposase
MDEISEADWETTPESVKRRVRSLVSRIEQLERQYEELKPENERLPEQVKQNSKNSSKPPSQDVNKGFKAKEKKLKGKPRGAQFGHVGHERKLYPVEQCQQVEEHYPATCIECGARLQGAGPRPLSGADRRHFPDGSSRERTSISCLDL